MSVNQDSSFEEEEEVETELTMFAINKSKFSTKERTFFLKQASLLLGLNNMNIGVTALTSMYMSKHNYFYLFERPTDVTLADYLIDLEKPLSVSAIKRIAFDLLQSSQMLHAKGIIHLDITPMNILVINPEGLDSKMPKKPKKEANDFS